MDELEQWRIQLQQWSRQGAEWFHQMPETQLYAAIAVVFVTTFFLLSSNSAFPCIRIILQFLILNVAWGFQNNCFI